MKVDNSVDRKVVSMCQKGMDYRTCHQFQKFLEDTDNNYYLYSNTQMLLLERCCYSRSRLQKKSMLCLIASDIGLMLRYSSEMDPDGVG